MYASGITYTGVASVSTPSTGPAGVNTVITFAVDDGQAGSPVNNQTTLIAAALQGQSLVNVQMLVVREGIGLNWNSIVQVNDIRRYNHAGQGGFSFEATSGIKFFTGERYMLFIISINTTDQV